MNGSNFQTILKSGPNSGPDRILVRNFIWYGTWYGFRQNCTKINSLTKVSYANSLSSHQLVTCYQGFEVSLSLVCHDFVLLFCHCHWLCDKAFVTSFFIIRGVTVTYRICDMTNTSLSQVVSQVCHQFVIIESLETKASRLSRTNREKHHKISRTAPCCSTAITPPTWITEFSIPRDTCPVRINSVFIVVYWSRSSRPHDNRLFQMDSVKFHHRSRTIL